MCWWVIGPLEESYMQVSETKFILFSPQIFGALLQGCCKHLAHLDLSKNTYFTKRTKESAIPLAWKHYFASTEVLEHVNLSENKLPPEAAKWVVVPWLIHSDGLVQERCNSIAKALELRFSCTNPFDLFIVSLVLRSVSQMLYVSLPHWGWVTHIFVSVNYRHRENFWAFTRPRIDFGLILLISNMIIHRSFTGPTHLLSANFRGPVSFAVSELAIIGSDNGLSPGQHQAIIWTNAGIYLIGPLGTNFSEIFIEILTFSFKKMHWKMVAILSRPQFIKWT